jgi:post-segregation antitoxin (ccd killing protein)
MWVMAQLYFYVPDDVAENLKRQAKAEGLSVSKYLAKLVEAQTGKKDAKGWPEGYFERLDQFQISDAFEIPEPPPLAENDPDWP